MLAIICKHTWSVANPLRCVSGVLIYLWFKWRLFHSARCLRKQLSHAGLCQAISGESGTRCRNGSCNVLSLWLGLLCYFGRGKGAFRDRINCRMKCSHRWSLPRCWNEILQLSTSIFPQQLQVCRQQKFMSPDCKCVPLLTSRLSALTEMHPSLTRHASRLIWTLEMNNVTLTLNKYQAGVKWVRKKKWRHLCCTDGRSSPAHPYNTVWLDGVGRSAVWESSQATAHGPHHRI